MSLRRITFILSAAAIVAALGLWAAADSIESFASILEYLARPGD